MSYASKREKAIQMRKQGISYNDIKKKIDVSKSTLSLWLRDMPLSRDQINQVRALSPKRIERCRNTKLQKKNARRALVFEKVSNEIGRFTKRDMLIAGMFLYWGEGTKTADCTTSLTNTDPSIIKFYVDWLESFGISRGLLRVKLHLYVDQDIKTLTRFWSNTTGIDISNFNKPYIKKSSLSDKTYKGMFPYGTCVISYHNRDMHEYVMEGIRYMREKYRTD